MPKRSFVFVLFFVFLNSLVNCFSSTSRTIALNSFSACPHDEKYAIHFDGAITKTTRNKYSVNGEFKFTDSAMGPIEVIV